MIEIVEMLRLWLQGLGVNGSIDLERLLERTSNDDGRGMVVLWWRVSHDNDLSLR